ncbi:MAG: hypothetical protein U0573_02200 [Phycisphaerales bacterium]|nr:hypothetical protein [Planctomycetota bacterium]
MHRFVRSVRCAGIASVGIGTLLAGAVLVWLLVQPEMLPSLPTWQLAAILSAFVLPALCLATWQADRRAAAFTPRRAPRLPGPAVSPQPSQTPPAAPPSSSAGVSKLSSKIAAIQLPSTRNDNVGDRRSMETRRVHRHRRCARV